MTKREMLMEMKPENGLWDVENRMRNKKARIEEVYEYYLKSKQTNLDKCFCFDMLIVW